MLTAWRRPCPPRAGALSASLHGHRMIVGAGATGTLPACWADRGAFPVLELLDLSANELSGRWLLPLGCGPLLQQPLLVGGLSNLGTPGAAPEKCTHEPATTDNHYALPCCAQGVSHPNGAGPARSPCCGAWPWLATDCWGMVGRCHGRGWPRPLRSPGWRSLTSPTAASLGPSLSRWASPRCAPCECERHNLRAWGPFQGELPAWGPFNV